MAPADLLLRAAHKGNLDVVLELFGAVSTRATVPADELAKILRRDILAEAFFILQTGGIHEKLPVLDMAINLLVASTKALATSAEATHQPSLLPTASSTTTRSLLDRARALLDTPTDRSGLQNKPLYLKAQPAYEVSEPSEASVTSATVLDFSFMAKLRNPALAVVLPEASGRPMSRDFDSPNLERMEAVACM